MDGRREPLFRLTKQRKTILDLLSRYAYLRTAHFYSLTRAEGDGAQRAVRRLLRDFWQRGYAVRRPLIDYAAPEPSRGTRTSTGSRRLAWNLHGLMAAVATA